MGRRGPRADHGGRLPRRPVAVRPPSPAQTTLPARHRLRRGSQLSLAGRRAGGRCCPSPPADCDPDDLAEAVAEQLAARWGVVFRDLLARENLAVPWREVLWALRRMEARGTISGGRFVTGFSGEQFAHPDAVGMLREIRKRPRTGETVLLSAADPLNLVGIVLPGPRIPALPDEHGQLYRRRRGAPVLTACRDGAVDGYRHAVTSADGTRIGLLTAGDGPPLLLVHGGMGCIRELAAPVGHADQPVAGDGHGPARPGHQRRHRTLRAQPGIPRTSRPSRPAWPGTARSTCSATAWARPARSAQRPAGRRCGASPCTNRPARRPSRGNGGTAPSP